MKILLVHTWNKNIGHLAILMKTVEILRNSECKEITCLVSHPELLDLPIQAKIRNWPWPTKKSKIDFIFYPYIIFSHFFLFLAIDFFKKEFSFQVIPKH